MKLPNAHRAVIAPEKTIDYLLNPEHERGASKAQVLLGFGYSAEQWQQLADDVRMYHLDVEIEVVRETAYGTRYEISGNVVTPSGRSLRIRTVWQIDRGTDFPRMITLFPD